MGMDFTFPNENMAVGFQAIYSGVEMDGLDNYSHLDKDDRNNQVDLAKVRDDFDACF
jgi:hypothetical protein